MLLTDIESELMGVLLKRGNDLESEGLMWCLAGEGLSQKG